MPSGARRSNGVPKGEGRLGAGDPAAGPAFEPVRHQVWHEGRGYEGVIGFARGGRGAIEEPVDEIVPAGDIKPETVPKLAVASGLTGRVTIDQDHRIEGHLAAIPGGGELGSVEAAVASPADHDDVAIALERHGPLPA